MSPHFSYTISNLNLLMKARTVPRMAAQHRFSYRFHCTAILEAIWEEVSEHSPGHQK